MQVFDHMSLGYQWLRDNIYTPFLLQLELNQIESYAHITPVTCECFVSLERLNRAQSNLIFPLVEFYCLFIILNLQFNRLRRELVRVGNGCRVWHGRLTRLGLARPPLCCTEACARIRMPHGAFQNRWDKWRKKSKQKTNFKKIFNFFYF